MPIVHILRQKFDNPQKKSHNIHYWKALPRVLYLVRYFSVACFNMHITIFWLYFSLISKILLNTVAPPLNPYSNINIWTKHFLRLHTITVHYLCSNYAISQAIFVGLLFSRVNVSLIFTKVSIIFKNKYYLIFFSWKYQ